MLTGWAGTSGCLQRSCRDFTFILTSVNFFIGFYTKKTVMLKYYVDYMSLENKKIKYCIYNIASIRFNIRLKYLC